MTARWAGTTLCLVGMALTAVNVYPLNLALSVAGSAIWADHGRRSGDRALWVVEIAAVVIGVCGLALWAMRRLP